MPKGLAGVKTPSAQELAKKWNLPLATIAKKIAAGSKVEREHTTSSKQAAEIARDHINERPDYYEKVKKMEKSPIKEETTTSGIGGLGFRTGTPAIDSDNQYTDTNSMSYEDWNGAILKLIRDKHHNHLIDMGFTSYSPNEIQNAPNRVVKEDTLNELGEYDNKGGMSGYEGTSGPIRAVRKNDMAEDKDPCWKGYEAIGMKKKNGRKVPNCVPVKEATYQGKKVPLNKPMQGDVKKSKVFVDPDGDGKAQKVNFGDPNMTIKKSNPARRKSFRARHNCDNPGPNTKARYWSCKAWEETQLDELHGKGDLEKIRLHHQRTANELSQGGRAQEKRMGAQGWKHRDSENRDSAIRYHMSKVKKAKSLMSKTVKEEHLDEISAELVGKVSNARFWQGKAPSKTLSNAIKKKYIESGEKDKGSKKEVKEETTMDKDLIQEALNNILSDNLSEMKENLTQALQEKAMEKLEERKKEIAANYFAE